MIMDKLTSNPEQKEPQAAIKDLMRDLTEVVTALDGTRTEPGSIDAGAKLAAKLLANGCVPRLEQSLQGIVEHQQRRQAERLAGLSSAEAMAVRSWRESGKTLRQMDAGWRIGPIELRLDRAAARASVRYNGLTVIAHEAVEGAAGLEALVVRANALLKEASILPPADLQTALWDAFLFAAQRSGGNTQGVELRSVLEELRTALVRRARPEKLKLAAIRLQPWALSWILDEAFRHGPPISGGQRLALRTGTQRETRDIGVQVGPRELGGEPQIYCYMHAVAAAPAPLALT
jgi:hypothetical protein